VSPTIREAKLGDAEAIAAIHDEAVIAGNATFRSDPRPLNEVRELLDKGSPFLVAEEDGEVIGWSSAGPYEESNPYYAGVREAAVYVAGSARGRGVGRALLDRLAGRVEGEKVFKLVAKVFTTNEASLRLFEHAGYTEVGTHTRHGRLRGEWKDVVVLEKLLGDARA
jgi:phosphinothricin acetyltransferase